MIWLVKLLTVDIVEINIWQIVYKYTTLKNCDICASAILLYLSLVHTFLKGIHFMLSSEKEWDGSTVRSFYRYQHVALQSKKTHSHLSTLLL